MVSAGYLARALVLYRSLARFHEGLQLRVCCLDELSYSLLSGMALPGVAAFPVEELEAFDPALVEVRPRRTPWEYAMTLKPSLCLHELERAGRDEGVAYLDADIMFFSDPEALFEEIGRDSILLVPHRYPPENDWMARAWGRYNAGTIVLRPGIDTLDALRWWRERCLEWCHRRPEEGRWADQKYLDEWPRRFSGVHVLEHPGGGLAPWNTFRHELANRDGAGLLVDGRPLVFYHYQGLRLYRGTATLRRLGLLSGRYLLVRDRPSLVWNTEGAHSITAREAELLWHPYLRALARTVVELRGVDPSFGFDYAESLEVAALRRRARRLSRVLRRGARRGRRLLRRRTKRARRLLRRARRAAVDVRARKK